MNIIIYYKKERCKMEFVNLIDCPKCGSHPVEIRQNRKNANYYAICITCGHQSHFWTDYQLAINEWNSQGIAEEESEVHHET